MPTFSIILATRDRPALFRVALDSVMTQTETDTEIIVVNDGSAGIHRGAYEQALSKAAGAIGGARIKPFDLVARPHGHGQSYALNYGVAQSRGDFLCFLDDDDRWTDIEHLKRAHGILTEAAARREPIDLYMTNQVAFRHDQPVPGPIWLESLAAQLRSRGQSASTCGTYRVQVADLLAAGGFCHLNCLITRRSLYEAVGGMDEGIRWECDRDLFLRLIDLAGPIVHHPVVVARHHVPTSGTHPSMTTTLPMLEKRLYQLRVLDKVVLFARNPALRAHGRHHKAITLKKIAQELARSAHWDLASYYAREALGAGPGWKWLLFFGYCLVRRLAAPRS